MNYERSKAPLALMEQIIMILVFALAAAICIRAFVYADQLSRKGEQRLLAAEEAQKVAEYVKNAGGDLEVACGVLSGERTSDGLVVSVPEKGMEVSLRLTENTEYLQRARVEVRQKDDMIYDLDVAWQIAE